MDFMAFSLNGRTKCGLDYVFVSLGHAQRHMAVKMLPQDVADAFVKQYYAILNKSPENVHKFYQESSLLGWPGSDGVVTPVTTLSGINDRVMSTDYKNCSVEIKTTDAQQSLEGGVIVAVTGSSTGEDDVKRNFSQTFFLAKQEKGFYVLNDILRFFDVCVSITDTVVKEDDVNDQPAPTMQNSVSRDISDGPASPQTKAVVENENGKVEEALDPLPRESVARKASSKSSVASLEKPRPVVAPPVSNVKEDAKKITYASMLAKEARVTSPRTALVTSSNQAVASPTTKSSADIGDGAPKVSTPTRAVSQAPVALSKVAPKLATPSNDAQNTGAYADARGIYIGRLPYDITKQGIVDVVKKFGAVRRTADTIQIRRHEDGFCCGFVEFESADAARRAVEAAIIDIVFLQAHHVYFGDKEAYITYKRSSYNRGNDGRERSPTKVGSGNGEVTSNERVQKETRAGYSKSSARGPRRSRSVTK
ncbi:hypothetical protein BUALT_Bualt17G0081200 [Buddleja alternifolia]|uniref:G3BP-like protein n=1 Tax=Buddleja alternifolia TaxID=168488 RepID=A0AAV6WHH7_9LAMI|nr:hypothetical protein BUALT_Bualt17G0081200 [Buddleja alternifolia]